MPWEIRPVELPCQVSYVNLGSTRKKGYEVLYNWRSLKIGVPLNHQFCFFILGFSTINYNPSILGYHGITIYGNPQLVLNQPNNKQSWYVQYLHDCACVSISLSDQLSKVLGPVDCRLAPHRPPNAVGCDT